MNIKESLSQIDLLSLKYGLRILSLDYTDVTVLCRIGFSYDVFIQVYLNSAKKKLNLALIVGGSRIYGVDKEGGVYHKHPASNPEIHIHLEKEVSLDEFILESIEILKEIEIL